MSFEKIVAAAKNQNLDELKEAISQSCIDCWKPGAYYFSAASQLALEGNIAAVDFLMTHGANINYAVLGAAQGGHQAYTEDLLNRGASIDYVAMGAGRGGHRAHAEDLLSRGADINYVARGATFGGHREYAENLLKRGARIHTVTLCAAISGNQTYAENLLNRSANINNVAMGAALGGHRAYVEELIKRGADIDYVARGAALGGRRDYAEDLLNRGASINYVAMGATHSGYRAYAEDLLKDGADINEMARDAAFGGHQAYAEDLLKRGAGIDYVAKGAVTGRHFLYNNAKNQMCYLSFFNPDLIPKLITALNNLNNPIKIDFAIQNKIIALSKHMHNGNVSYASALTRTGPDCRAMLYLLMKVVMSYKQQLLDIPFDIWIHIFNFITPIKLNAKEAINLGFVMGRTYFGAQLSIYQAGCREYKEEVKNFHDAVIQAKNKEELTQLVNHVEIKTLDKFHGIIEFWKKELTEDNAKFENENSLEKRAYSKTLITSGACGKRGYS